MDANATIGGSFNLASSASQPYFTDIGCKTVPVGLIDIISGEISTESREILMALIVSDACAQAK